MAVGRLHLNVKSIFAEEGPTLADKLFTIANRRLRGIFILENIAIALLILAALFLLLRLM
jgi:hypothetical protein